MTATRIIRGLTYLEFKEVIDKYKGRIKVNPHAYFRLDEMQRKVYKDDTLIGLLTEEKPAFVGIQQNNNYAAFFSRKQGYIRLIFKVTEQGIEIITFYTTDHIPKI